MRRQLGRVCFTTLDKFCNQKHGHLGGCSLDANDTEPINSTAESTEYEDAFDTYTGRSKAHRLKRPVA